MLLALIKKEILALTRDVHGLAALFLMPVLFIIIMSLALKDVYSPAIKSLPYVVDNRDSSPLSVTLLLEWEKRHGTPQVRTASWQDEVRSGKLGYALVIEKDFSRELAAKQTGSAKQLRLITDPGIDNGVFSANNAELSMIASELRGQALLAATQAMAGKNRTPPQSSRAENKVPPQAADATFSVSAQALVDSERLAAGSRPTSVQQNVPAWLVFGMFFVVASLANLFLQERQCGALARLASLGVPTSMMIWSKALPYRKSVV